MLETIVDLIRDLRAMADMDTMEKAAQHLGTLGRRDSIISRARDMVATFPALISTGVSQDSASVICRALEVRYATLIRTVIMADDIVDIDRGGSKRDLVRKFHQNTEIGMRPAIARGLSSMSRSFTGLSESETSKPVANPFPDEAAVRAAARELRSGIAMDLRLENLNAMTITSATLEAAGLSQPVTGNGQNGGNGNGGNGNGRGGKPHSGFVAAAAAAAQTAHPLGGLAVHGVAGAGKLAVGGAKLYAAHKKDQASQAASQSSSVNSAFDNTDVKKAGAMEPLLLKLNVVYKNQSGQHSTEIIIGVQVIPHFVPAEEIVQYVGESVRMNSPVFRAIQWTTGEIKFWRDLVLTVDTLQRDAVLEGRSDNKSSAKWWNKLRSMAAGARFKNFLSQHKMLPNATLIMSGEDEEQLATIHGVDVSDPRTAERIINAYFLLSLVVMSDPQEACKVYEEDTQSWSLYSYKALGKQGSSGEVKELISLLSK